MFTDEIRRALAVSPRAELTQLSSAVWKGYAAGAIGETDAQQLADEIEARKIVPTPPRSAPRRVGSRPATPASMDRRRRWTASGRMPPQLAARFTMAEQAVLALVAAEVCRRGDCRLPIGHLAAVAGVSATTVRNAMRAAAASGLITVEERRITYWRNLPNIVRIVAPEWTGWLRLRRSLNPASSNVPQGHNHQSSASTRGGCKLVQPTHTDSRLPPKTEDAERFKAFRRKTGEGRGP